MYIFLLLIFLSINLFADIDFNKDNNVKQKIALLTFDDGPIKATKNILKVVEDENIPITMFFIGYQIEKSNHIYKQALNLSNVTIANHTYSHANNKYQKFYSDPIFVIEDIKKANSLILQNEEAKKLSSFAPVRLAGRNVFRTKDIKIDDYAISKEQTSIEILAYNDIFNEGFNIYGWDIEWQNNQDGEPIQTPEQIFYYMENIYKQKASIKENKVILLMHDILFSSHFEGEKNLKTLIQLLKNGGWSFENIEDY